MLYCLKSYLAVFLCCLFTVSPFHAVAQTDDNTEVFVQGKRYLDINLRCLSKYQQRVERKQEKLLSQLKKKERRFEHSLKKTDSIAWARFQEQKLSYDSIARLSAIDSFRQPNRLAAKPNAVIDSLKGVSVFIQQTAGTNSLIQAEELSKYNSELTALQSKLAYRDYINELIAKRMAELSGLVSKGSLPGLSSIQQKVYYAKAQMKAYKAMAEDPGKLEEKAYEILQGKAGFEEGVDKAVNGAYPMSGSGGNLTAGDLERLGYQTKRQVNASIQQRFGDNIGAVQQQMGSQMSAWQKETQGLTSQVKETKQSIQSLKSVTKPSFKINPMRCLPFWQRVEKSYDFQTSRATADGKPAMLQLGGMAAYRHTPKLSTGIGIAASFGLGPSWSRIRFTFEGVGLRSFASWQIMWGINAYTGYERMYKETAFSNTNARSEKINAASIHSTSKYNESVLIGLTKSYSINSKNKGSVQLLYDIWWKEKQLNSPIVIRFSNNL